VVVRVSLEKLHKQAATIVSQEAVLQREDLTCFHGLKLGQYALVEVHRLEGLFDVGDLVWRAGL
jgi:hypothetical protein